MLTTKDKEQLLKFLQEWAKPMQELLNARFGKNKVAHILITVDTGNQPTITYSTNLRDGDFKRCLSMLSDKINDSRIIR